MRKSYPILSAKLLYPCCLVLFCALFVSAILPVSAQHVNHKKMVQKLMKSQPEHFKKILDNPEKYRVQVLYTQIDRDAQNKPHFTSYGYRLNAQEYFYPASTVKLPTALAALEKLNNLNLPGLNKYTPMLTDSAYSRQSAAKTDTTAENGLPSVAHYIKKIFLVSDNDAYNRLYEFVGQRPLNEMLHQKGFNEVRIVHRLNIFRTPDENRHTNPIAFFDGQKIVYQQPLVENPVPFENKLKNTKLGKAHYLGLSDTLVQEPMEFGGKNYISIEVLQNLLRTILFPEAVPATQRFNLTPDDYTFLYKYMSMLPRESDFPKYKEADYPDSYLKFLMFGDSKQRIPDHIRSFNKSGSAYGFLLDNAYIADFENKIEFMLTAVILVDKDEIFNDDTDEYVEEGYPFMQHLGQAIYQHELKRRKKHLPDLSKFRLNYR